MTYKELLLQQEIEWEDFYKEKDESFIRLLQRRDELFGAVSNANGKVSEKIRDLQHKEFQLWFAEWGVNGTRKTLLKERHQNEREQHRKREMDLKELIDKRNSRQHDISLEL